MKRGRESDCEMLWYDLSVHTARVKRLKAELKDELRSELATELREELRVELTADHARQLCSVREVSRFLSAVGNSFPDYAWAASMRFSTENLHLRYLGFQTTTSDYVLTRDALVRRTSEIPGIVWGEVQGIRVYSVDKSTLLAYLQGIGEHDPSAWVRPPMDVWSPV